MKISSPDKTYTGESRYGEVVLQFEDGVAKFDGELPAGVRQYMLGAGYGIGSKKPADPEDTPAPPDPRDVTHESVGTPLRDAAVDPKDGDFLAPTNAGTEGPEGNPHGPNVVSPQIHGSVGQPVVPGPVGTYEEHDVKDDEGNVTGKVGVVLSDPAAQEKRETEYAERALVGNEPVPEVLADIGAKANPDSADPTGETPDEALELKGAALDQALEEAGLSKTGTADEKRARLAEHRSA
ncbi:hypothetical protein [Intrasporangium flavum]|uniref:hypothetical protein n=1 Tax=Intrasporangium flavum TaxID=1428657 RepID=UPI00096F0E35|nr:hypothetical protein [Intrasporangium flavum]